MKKVILTISFSLFLGVYAWAQIPVPKAGQLEIAAPNANTRLGTSAGLSLTTGGGNTFLGEEAGTSNTTAGSNTFVGWRAGRFTTIGHSNTFVGTGAGETNRDGIQNTFVGRSAGFFNTTGVSNTFLGFETGLNNTTGRENTFLGLRAGVSNTEGVSNTYVGVGAGGGNLKGSENVALGRDAGLSNTAGVQNTYLGRFSGFNNQGSGNVFLGYRSGFNETSSNKLYIDNSDTPNPLIYGDFAQKVAVVNGSLGIGIKNPERPIHLRATNAIFRIDRDRDDPGFAVVRYDNGFSNVWKSFYFYTHATGVNTGQFVIADWGTNVSGPSTPRLVIDNSGNIGIGTTTPGQKLSVSGNVLATGSFITSDKRFKKDIQAIPSAMERINQLKGVSYAFETQKFADKGFSEGKNLGLIAQEVEKVFPELVVEDAEGFKAVNYDGLIPVLIEALKEQQRIIQAQKEDFENRIAILEKSFLGQSPESLKTSTTSNKLYQNQPNPFGESTLITYHLAEENTQAMILITDLQGRELSRLPISQKGEGSVTIQAGSLNKGIYLYTLVVDGKIVDSKRMLIAE